MPYVLLTGSCGSLEFYNSDFLITISIVVTVNYLDH